MNRKGMAVLAAAGLAAAAAFLLAQCGALTGPRKGQPFSRLDAFVVNYGNDNQVYLNDGHGSFTVHQVTASGDSSSSADWSHAVALGDLNGDGHLDAFVANYGRNRVYINDGSGSFTGYDVGTDEHDSWDVALGDLDGDGDLDAIVANGGLRWDEVNRVYLNQGDGRTFIGHDVTGDTHMSCAVALLGGVHPDALVINYYQANRLYRNQGFVPGGEPFVGEDVPGAGLAMGTCVAVGDMNWDGIKDAVVGNYKFGAVQANLLYLRNESGELELQGGMSDSSRDTTGVALGDLDGDLDLDVFVCHTGSAPRVGLNAIYPSGGALLCSFETVEVIDPPDPADIRLSTGVALGDLDGDGDLDAFVANNGTNRMYLNGGLGRSWQGFELPPAGPQFNSTGVALGDLDGR